MMKNKCKAISKKGWVFGQLLQSETYSFMVTEFKPKHYDINTLDLSDNKLIVVAKTTVSYSTGYKDRNKKDIYENDVVVAYLSDNEPVHDGIIQFKNGAWYLDSMNLHELSTNLHLEVTGNIYDKEFKDE